MEDLKKYDNYFKLIGIFFYILLFALAIIIIDFWTGLSGLYKSLIVFSGVFFIALPVLSFYFFKKYASKICEQTNDTIGDLEQKLKAEKNKDVEDKVNKQKEKKEREERIERLLKGLDKSSDNVESVFLSNLATEFHLAQVLLYKKYGEKDDFKLTANFAYYAEDKKEIIKIGEGLSGQAIKNKKELLIDDIPENYITILSGMGKASPKYLYIYPLRIKDEVKELFEFASFEKMDELKDNIAEIMDEYKKIGKLK